MLENQLKERFLLVPNFPLHPIAVTSCPFSSHVTSCISSEWYSNVKTRFYLYPIHLSEVFLKTETLSSSLYLLVSLFLRKDYNGVARILSSCSTDTPLSREEEWILQMIRLTVVPGPGIVVDSHPNAVALRLKLALLVIESGAKQIPWQFAASTHNSNNSPPMDFIVEDMTNYIAKYSHVSDLCRLTADEEHQLLLWIPGKFPVRERYVTMVKQAGSSGRYHHGLC